MSRRGGENLPTKFADAAGEQAIAVQEARSSRSLMLLDCKEV